MLGIFAYFGSFFFFENIRVSPVQVNKPSVIFIDEIDALATRYGFVWVCMYFVIMIIIS